MEDFEVDERSHARLTAAISKLDRTQHIKIPARGEPTARTGEFDLVKTNRLGVAGVVSVLENSARHVEIGKTLKKTQAPDRVLLKPLEKPQAERIKRSSAFQTTRKKLNRWDATVARNRTVDHVSFPLKTANNRLVPSKDYLSKLKLKSELERELDEVEGRGNDIQEVDEEENYPMTYEEMLEHRKELAKLRAQQSFKAAKAKRQSKIKSKKYHRILKKERMKQQLADFEALQKTDPESALRKLESLERARAEERHTLRHKNTGKWAKSKLVRAKYNPEVRQQLADQLAVSRGLTQKVKMPDESSSDESEHEEPRPHLPLTKDPMNPWMLQNSGKSKEEEQFEFGYKKYVTKKLLPDDSSSNDENQSNENTDVRNGEDLKYKTVPNGISPDEIKNKDEENTSHNNIISQCSQQLDKSGNNAEVNDNNLSDNDGDKTETNLREAKKVLAKEIPPLAVSTTDWIVDVIDAAKSVCKNKRNQMKIDLTDKFDNLESDISKKVEEKLSKMRQDIDKMNVKSIPNRKRKAKEEDSLAKLEFKTQKRRPIIDAEMHETTDRNPAANRDGKSINDLATRVGNTIENSDAKTSDVDPTMFIAAKPKYLATALSGGNDGFNNLDDEQVVPKVNIEEVFEEDDVVASFRQEKEDEINMDKPADIDPSLPGWGSWGGKGVKAPKKKRSRFIFKAPIKLPRRDDNKGDIIIKEYKEPKLAAHKVTELPFPFTSLKDFEASIRAPLGNTFIPEIAHRKIIKPSIFTKSGTIIEPMDDDELLKPRNQNYKNEAVIKLLGNK